MINRPTKGASAVTPVSTFAMFSVSRTEAMGGVYRSTRD
jgi:hypothetical protein